MKKVSNDRSPLYLVTLVILSVINISCLNLARISDATPAKLVHYERIKKGTSYLITLEDPQGNQVQGFYNAHCYNCKGLSIPGNWNVATLRNGKKYISPIR